MANTPPKVCYNLMISCIYLMSIKSSTYSYWWDHHSNKSLQIFHGILKTIRNVSNGLWFAVDHRVQFIRYQKNLTIWKFGSIKSDFSFSLQLRKQNAQFICALWLDKATKLGLPSILLNSPFFTFVYGLIYRNILAVLTGISAVFVHKHDFNA